MARGGRKRKPGKRERNGRPQRENTSEIKQTATEQRFRVVSARDASSERAGFPLGVLSLRKAISEPLFQAGVKWAQIYSTYAIIMGMPRTTPQACQIGALSGVPLVSEMPPDVIEQRKAQYESAEKALRAGALSPGHNVVNAVCMRDEYPDPEDVDWLLRGLEVLANHFRTH